MVLDNVEIRSTATNAKYINRYIIKGALTELHITDDKDYDVIIKVDTEDCKKLQNHFWCCSFVGRNGYQTPSFYCYLDKKHTLLSRVLLPAKSGDKVIFLNNDNTDYRKENLHIVKKKQSIIRDETDKEIPTGIFKKIQKEKGNVTGYLVCYFENNNKKTKYFGVRKYKKLSVALEKAIEFKKNMLKKEGIILAEVI